MGLIDVCKLKENIEVFQNRIPTEEEFVWSIHGSRDQLRKRTNLVS